MHSCTVAFLRAALIIVLVGTLFTAAAAEKPDGKQLYLAKCASCHGKHGEGVTDKYDEALYGNRSLAELIDVIDETMPEDNADECTGAESEAVGRYIYETFYTAAARAKNKPPRIELSRLTVPQYENSVADLVAGFTGQKTLSDRHGLEAEYFNDRSFNRRERKIERVDAKVDFNFGTKSPHEDIRDSEFSIRWQGSVLVHETGVYEFGVKTENGFQLWINDDDEPLVDGYVAAGPQPTQRNGTIKLLAGRAYPLELEWFKYKDKSASVQLLWKPPHKAWELLPERHLSPEGSNETFVVTTAFPADDSSLGYPRGTAVSQEWDEATTYAAVEVANYVVSRLSRLSGANKNDAGRKQKYQDFCAKFTERAFRRPLTDTQRQVYVTSHFESANVASSDDAADGDALEQAVKRSVLMTLKSPHFLYVNLPREAGPDNFDVASRLSYALWDSLPDEKLRQAAARNELQTPEQVTAQANRMLQDPRTTAKLRSFFAHWLQLDHSEHLAKNAEAFSGYDEQLQSDLRTSLELFVDEVIASDPADYRRLLLADHWFANGRVAKFYGLDVEGDGFEKVSVEADRRAGVLTHPYMLASLSYFETTSPIHRGVFASRRILSRPLMPPPNAILFENAKFDPHLTMREKVTELTKAQDCQSCHSIINPLGFSLENFDAVGRFRTMEKEKPIDANSEYVAANGEKVQLASARDLAQFAATSEAAQRGFVEKLFHHAVKQPAAAYGENTLQKLHESFVQKQYNIRELFIEIAATTALSQQK